MTHEELVEKVAEGIAQEYGFIWHTLTDQPDTRFGPPPVCKEHLRGCARAAIKIVGEACKEAMEDDKRKMGDAVMMLTVGGCVDTIQSLTQGEKP